jgi:hypothetical protein
MYKGVPKAAVLIHALGVNPSLIENHWLRIPAWTGIARIDWDISLAILGSNVGTTRKIVCLLMALDNCGRCGPWRHSMDGR